MCGIFGMVRNADANHPERATAVFAELGRHSVSRGRDSAGYAAVPWDGSSSTKVATRSQVDAKFAHLEGGVFIAKDTKTFDDFWEDERDIPVVAASAVVIGHTRAATQGSRGAKTNTSPLAVGTIVGTHNGDINATSVLPWHEKGDKVPFGATDTESLYRALNNVRSHRRKIADILASAEGRVALAWYDRRLPNRMYLARGGLSPMAVAYDAEGNFYWASSPQWFRDIDKKFDGAIGFEGISIVPEGSLITVNFGNGFAEVTDLREFEPIVRHSDTLLPESIVWRGFPLKDKSADKDNSRHVVLPAPVRKPVTSLVGHNNPYMGSSDPDRVFAENASFQQGYGLEDPWEEFDEKADNSFTDFLTQDAGTEDHFGSCSDDEASEAIDAAADYLSRENANVLDGSVVRPALLEAKMQGAFAKIAADFGLSNERSAQAFVALVLDTTVTI